MCCENKITYGVNYHKESKKRELAVNSFLNITDAVKGQLCFNGHLYKLDPIYIPSLISTDSLQDGQRFSSFQKYTIRGIGMFISVLQVPVVSYM